MHKLVVGLGLLLVAGCVSSEPPTYEAVQPITFAGGKDSILADMRNTFFDPPSIRDAEASDVIFVSNAGYNNASGMGPKLMICVRANAKNRFGGYTGEKVYAYFYNDYGDHGAYQSDDHIGPCLDANPAYHPFPEAEHLE